MRYKAHGLHQAQLAVRTAAALGRSKADVVIKNAQILDVFSCEFFCGDVAIADGVVVGTQESYQATSVIDATDCYVVPGFIDSHVHIESSLMTPARFQQCVLPHGTTTALWDPHEIANVLGTKGIDWAISSSDDLLMDIFILAPSCVPASHLETNGAGVSAADLKNYVRHPRVLGLAEVMNYPGVLYGDKDVWEKLELFSNGIRDGHAPQVRGRELNCYLCAGIQACHESTTMEEAREKLRKGMHVLVREGSCAKDADELLPLINDHTSAVVALCSDDRNPADIAAEGHINFILNRGLEKDLLPQNVFRSASFAAARAYGFYDRGVVAPGYLADLVVVKPRQKGNWKAGFDIVHVIKAGQLVDDEKIAHFAHKQVGLQHPKVSKKNVNIKPFPVSELQVKAQNSSAQRALCNVIGIRPNQIITDKRTLSLPVQNGCVGPDLVNDVLKIVVIERHHATGNKTIAFCQGFGLKKGAIAASIGHDSHNVVVIGATDSAIYAAQKAIEDCDGGIVVCDEGGGLLARLALPIGGLMTDAEPDAVAQVLSELKTAAKQLGCVLHEPFLQMSFLALPVIPTLKITDKGLVDVERFDFVPLQLG